MRKSRHDPPGLPELAGPPLQRDTVQAVFFDCSQPSCPIASATMRGNRIRLLNSQGLDLTVGRPTFSINIEVTDHSADFESPPAVQITGSGDSEILALDPVSGPGRFMGTISVVYGQAAPGNGRLEAMPGSTLTASAADPLGLSAATDSVAIAEDYVELLDHSGNPARNTLIEGPVRVRAKAPAANLDDLAVDTVAATLSIYGLSGYLRDRETLLLTESGAATEIFTGELPSHLVTGAGSLGDGLLQVAARDYVQARVAAATNDAIFLPGLVRFVDAGGIDVVEVRPGTVYLELESYLANQDDNAADEATVNLDNSMVPGNDWESVVLTETGSDSAIFRGSIEAAIAAPTANNSLIEGALGDTLTAIYEPLGPAAIDQAQLAAPLNLPPEALNDSVTTPEDQPVTVEPLTNDSDPNDELPILQSWTQPAHGNVAPVPGNPGQLRYTPALDYFGSDSFTYTIADAAGLTASATVTVTLSAVDDSPVAAADLATVNEDSSVSIRARLNDTDPEGDAIALVRFDSASAHGTVVAGTGIYDFRYIPAANYFGADSFTYEIEAGGKRATGSVTVTVVPVPDAPIAVADSATTIEGTPVTIAVLANDRDPDGQSIFLLNITTNGANVVANSNGTVTYTPAANFWGTRIFSYRIRDAGGSVSSSATVTVNVQIINEPPVAQNEAFNVNEDVSTALNVMANDSDPDGPTGVRVQSVTQPGHGTVTLISGVVRYVSTRNYNGPDSFTYTLVDDGEATSTATVNLTVKPVNDPPVAGEDLATTAEDTAVVIDVLANDSDPDGDALTLSLLDLPAHGTVTQVVVGGRPHFLYTPHSNLAGGDSFSYVVTDPNLASNRGEWVYLTVTPIDDPPVAADDSATTDAGDSVTIAVLANDSDIEGDLLSVTVVGAPLHGGAVRNGDNTVTYTPAPGYSGADSFTYTASAGGATATATVSIVVEGPQLSQVSVLALRSIWIETGADILSGDVVANSAGGPPYLGASELDFGSGITMAAGYSARANGVTIASGTTIAADVVHNALASSGSITGATVSPLALPVFGTLPPLLTGTPGTTDVTVAQNVAITLAPGAYRDLIVAKKGVVTFSGGAYTFRSIQIAREVDLLFAAPSIVKVEGRMATATMTKIQPGPGSTATPATIEFHIAGINGSNGYLASTPKSVEIATENVLKCNFYVPNGTLWLQARTVGLGAFAGKNVRLGPDVQISLASAW